MFTKTRLGMLILVTATLGVAADDVIAQPAGVSLDLVVGVRADDSTKIHAGKPLTFYIRLNNQTGADGMCPGNGFKFYSPDGAIWEPHAYIDTTIKTFPPPTETLVDTTMYGRWVSIPGDSLIWKGPCPDIDTNVIFDGGIFVNTFSGTGWGSGADTVGFFGFAQDCGSGMWDGFTAIAWSLAIDSIPHSEIGKFFCIDSAYYPPSGKWLWSDGIQVEPPWDGPHCFEIVSCCIGTRGNVDGDSLEAINLPDLTGYVSWAYKGGAAPPCRDEVDMNGDGSVDTSDLSYLVRYMFKGGPPPAACP